MKVPVAVIIITYNEEINLPFALKSVCNWASQVFVVDSFSTDKTVEISTKLGAEVYKHTFEGYTEQRNWALKNLPIKTEWVLFLDADEYLSEPLKEEIKRILDELVNEGYAEIVRPGEYKSTKKSRDILEMYGITKECLITLASVPAKGTELEP